MSVIEVRGLTAWAGTSALLRGVDLDVPAGGVTALVGPSGSGKTTAALALLGDTAPGVRLSGAVRVAGTTVVDEHGVTREAAGLRGGTIAYMPQHPGSALNPARRTGAVLTELTRLHHRPGPGSPDGRAAARDRAAQALRAAQLPRRRRCGASPISSPAVSGSASPSPRCWPAARGRSSWTNPAPDSTP